MCVTYNISNVEISIPTLKEGFQKNIWISWGVALGGGGGWGEREGSRGGLEKDMFWNVTLHNIIAPIEVSIFFLRGLLK